MVIGLLQVALALVLLCIRCIVALLRMLIVGRRANTGPVTI